MNLSAGAEDEELSRFKIHTFLTMRPVLLKVFFQFCPCPWPHIMQYDPDQAVTKDAGNTTCSSVHDLYLFTKLQV